MDKKGFRQASAPSKKELERADAQLEAQVKNLQANLEVFAKLLSQSVQNQKALQAEVEGMAVLSASSETSDGATKGDHVMMDYLGQLLNEDGSPETKDGKPSYFEGGYGATFVLQGLGSGKLIPGFEDAIIGRKAGEEFDVQLQFPADYPAKTVAGRKVNFSVAIRKVYKQLPETSVQRKFKA